MKMSHYERVMAALNRQEVDRVPFCELAIDRAIGEALMGWKDSGAESSGTMRKNPYTVEEHKAIASTLGLDNLGFILRAPDYATVKTGKDGRGFPADGVIKTEADLDKINLPDPYDDAYYAEAEEFLAGKEDYPVAFITRIGLTQVYLSMGMERFYLALHDNRALIETMLDLYFDWMVVVAERACQLGFDFFWTTDDFAFKTGLSFSPNVFRELLVPRYKRVLEKVTIPWVLHSDGNIKEALEILIELGVVATHPNEKGAMDILAIKHEFGDRICVMGNVDLVTLGRGTAEEVVNEVRELIRKCGPGGGYIITSGNSIASYLKPENVLAMAEAVKKYGGYPIDLS